MSEYNLLAGAQKAAPRSMPEASPKPGINSKPNPAGNGEGSFYGDWKRGSPQPITDEQRLRPEKGRR